MQHLVESDHTQQAIKTFGITYYKTRAGFMLKDGRLLDLSDEGGYRDDHRAIADAMEDEEFDSQSEYLIVFMNEGNIRLIPELPGIDIVEEPTDQQYKALEDYIQFWINRERHFEVQFSDRIGHQLDWKEFNGYTPVAEIVLEIKRHFEPNLDEEDLYESYDYKASDLIGTDSLYHATYKPYWEEIKKSGRLKSGIHSNWEGLSDGGLIYLSKDYDNAVSYAETAEDIPEEFLDQIIVLEIDADKLDLDSLDLDHNQAYRNYDEVNIEDPFTWVELEYSKPIPLNYIRRVYDESTGEPLKEFYPHKGERKVDFINRFMRAESSRFPNVKQRYAVAYSYWDKSRKDRSLREFTQDKTPSDTTSN